MSGQPWIPLQSPELVPEDAPGAPPAAAGEKVEARIVDERSDALFADERSDAPLADERSDALLADERSEASLAEERSEAPPADERPWTGATLQPYEVGDPGRAAREVIATLSENPSDPADTQLDGATTGSLVVRAASSRGTSHRHSGTPRQDDYAICVCEDRWLVSAVADGVSAGWLSHQAATIACRGAAALVREALLESADTASLPWVEILGEVARRIVAHGQRTLSGDSSLESIAPDEVARAMATTLVVLVLPLAADNDGTRVGTVLALGDTSVFLLSAAGAWSPVTKVKNEGAEIASNATVALPYLPAEELQSAAVKLASGEALFVMTDGVGDPLGRGDGPVGSFLASVWRTPPDMFSFGAQVGFARRSFDDDRTVVGIWAQS